MSLHSSGLKEGELGAAANSDRKAVKQKLSDDAFWCHRLISRAVSLADSSPLWGTKTGERRYTNTSPIWSRKQQTGSPEAQTALTIWMDVIDPAVYLHSFTPLLKFLFLDNRAVLNATFKAQKAHWAKTLLFCEKYDQMCFLKYINLRKLDSFKHCNVCILKTVILTSVVFISVLL